MDPSDTGGVGWLSSLLGGGQAGAPSSSGAPGIVPGAVGPSSVGGAPLAPGPGGPTLAGGLSALGAGGPAMMKAMTPPPVPAPQIQMPRPQQQPYAQALAQVMAQLNAKPQGGTTPGGTQPS